MHVHVKPMQAPLLARLREISSRPNCRTTKHEMGPYDAFVYVYGGVRYDPLSDPLKRQGLAVEHHRRGDHRPPPAGEERPLQDQELTDEAVQAGETDRGEHDQCEHPGQHRCRLLHRRW